MNVYRTIRLASIAGLVAFGTVAAGLAYGQPGAVSAPMLRRTLTFDGAERAYFVGLPANYDPGTLYWILVSAHGGGSDGSNFWLSRDLVQAVADAELNAIVVSPSFNKDDPNAQQFPLLGEGAFLEAVIDAVQSEYHVHDKILLTGYSRGGQFAHRFALYYPRRVQACAPISAGSWTTPDGRFMMYGVGEVADAEAFLGDAANSAELAPAQQKLFNATVGDVAHRRADPQAKAIPFLIMCGALDERYGISQEFAASLESLGYSVETAWPRTAHGGRSSEEMQAEFRKYAANVAAFFARRVSEE